MTQNMVMEVAQVRNKKEAVVLYLEIQVFVTEWLGNITNLDQRIELGTSTKRREQYATTPSSSVYVQHLHCASII
jgi:hypothetical protein